MDHNLSFRQFIELQQVQPSYLGKISDELGIDSKDVAKNPQWLPNTVLGKYSYNGMTYDFRYVYDRDGNVSGAMIKPLETLRAYAKNKDGHNVRMPNDNPDKGKEFFVNIDQLNKMLNPESSQPQQGMGGMPGAIS